MLWAWRDRRDEPRAGDGDERVLVRRGDLDVDRWSYAHVLQQDFQVPAEDRVSLLETRHGAVVDHESWPVAFRLKCPRQLNVLVGKHCKDSRHDREQQCPCGGSCSGSCVPVEVSGWHSRVVSDEVCDAQGCRHRRRDGDEEERSSSHASIVALREDGAGLSRSRSSLVPLRGPAPRTAARPGSPPASSCQLRRRARAPTTPRTTPATPAPASSRADVRRLAARSRRRPLPSSRRAAVSRRGASASPH